MSKRGVRPEDVLADSESSVNLNGVTARKGSIAAFLRNIDLLEEGEDPEEKEGALKMIEELAPAVVASGLHKHATFKNKIIKKILEETASRLKGH